MPRYIETLAYSFEYNDCGVSIRTFNILHNEVMSKFSFFQYIFLNDNAFSLYSKNNFIITLKANKRMINNKNMIYTNILRVKKKIPIGCF